jgi:Rod binding domain-containing protein
VTAVSDSAAALAALSTGPLGGGDLERLRGRSTAEVAKEFEVLLLSQVIAAMRRTVSDSGLLSASPERRILDGVFDAELARSVAERADLGIARRIAGHLDGRDAEASSASAAARARGAQVYRESDESILDARWARLGEPLSRGRDR